MLKCSPWRGVLIDLGEGGAGEEKSLARGRGLKRRQVSIAEGSRSEQGLPSMILLVWLGKACGAGAAAVQTTGLEAARWDLPT